MKNILIAFTLIAFIILFSNLAIAENKFSTDIIPKLTEKETKDAPELDVKKGKKK